MIMIFGEHVQNDDISSNFLHFFRILIFFFFAFEGGLNEKKNDPQMPVSVCHVPYLRNCKSICGTQV